MRTFAVAFLFLLTGFANGILAQDAAKTAEDKARARRMEWFNKARFGMFIHWGIYSVPAGEWKNGKWHAEWIMLTGHILSPEYEKFAAQFNPTKFNAKEWVRVAKEAGMKYMVITSKHHDGFCMYDTKLTDYNIVKATPFHRDPMKELAPACRDAGLKFCFYYSIADWHHPDFPAKYSQHGFHGSPNPNADLEKYVAYMKGQVRELLTNYGPIGIMWFDGGGSFRGYPMAKLIHAQEIINMIRKLQPDCIVNNRLGLPGDYGTPEQHIPGRKSNRPFEVCMTLNHHWGYNKFDHDWKQPPVVIHNLADIASKGGNYLLNVGPTAEGIFPPEAVKILLDVGKWMKANGDSIYGTTASPFDYVPKWGRVTTKGNTLYLHVFDWPKDGALRLERLETKARQAYLLTDTAHAPLAIKQTDEETIVRLPAQAPDPIDSVVVLELAGPPKVTPKCARQANDGSITLKAIDAIIHGTKAHYEFDAKKGKDNIGYWVDVKDWASWWLKIDRPGTFNLQVVYACPNGTEGSPFLVSIAGSEIKGNVEATGSWSSFKTFDLGTVKIKKAGRYSLSVKPVKIVHGALMNLKAVKLVPVVQ